MGTMTRNRTTMGNIRRHVSLLWKLMAIIVIIQTIGINAKDIQNDLTFDDTFDIDQFEDAISSSSKLRSARDLDEQAFIEDELQPVDKSESESLTDGSWLMQSVKRVRRELGRLFGSEEKKLIESKKHAKNALKAEKLRKRQAKLAEKEKRKALASHVGHTNKSKNRLNKRQSYDEVEGSGDDNETYGERDMWQTLFTVSEPWQEEYRMGKSHQVFNDLQLQIQNAFHDFVNQNYGDDEDNFVQPTLIRVESTNDIYKIHCIVQVDLPERWSDFGQRLRQYLIDYKRFGQDFSADADNSFYFRRVRELQDHESVDVTTDYSHNNAAEHHGDGSDINHVYQGTGEGNDSHNVGSVDENETYNPHPHVNFGECDEQGYFHCRNNQVIDCAYRCDNKADCDDDSDEEREMCDKYFEEDKDADEEEALEGNEVDANGAPPVDPYGEATESPNYDNNNSYDPYDYDREQEMERERQLQLQREREHQLELERERQRQEEHERELAEQERVKQYEQEREREERARELEEREREERVREEAEREREQRAREEADRAHQYELEEAERVRQQQEREEQERREHEKEHENQPEVRPHPTGDEDRSEEGEVYDCNVNPNGYFACHSGELVPCYTVCDNQIDCQDGSDEDECHPEITTGEVTVESQSGNAANNGPDFEASGEDYTPVTETSPVYTSQYDVGCRGDTTFNCHESGKTICEEQLCDGEEQCPDGEDEMDCPGYDGDYQPDTQCEENEFRCDNRCLPKEYLCNGISECYDNADEQNCPKKGELF